MAPQRPRHTRARTGCLTCRSRRKKCDVFKTGLCQRCLRNGLDCLWPAGRTTGIESGSSPASPLIYTSDDTLVTAWNPTLGAFVLSSNRAASLYPSSQLLLRMYLSNTVSICTHLPSHRNPFVTYVLPLATTDDLVMNVVLAMAGVHYTTSGQDLGSPEVYRDTYKHYSLAIQGLRDACLTETSSWNDEKTARVLLVLVLLAHVESLRGDASGSIYPHLRAGSHLVKQFAHFSGSRTQNSFADIEGFALETYLYLALVSKIVPDDLSTGRFVTDDFLMTNLGWLRGYSSFGVFFEYSLGLFEKIPIIQSLARDCLQEWRATLHIPDTKTPTTAGITERLSRVETGAQTPTLRTYKALRNQVTDLIEWLQAWTCPKPIHSQPAHPNEHQQAGEVWRQALLIYLKACCLNYDTNRTMIGNTSLGEPDRHYPVPSQSTLDEIDRHLDVVLTTVPSVMLTRYGATMLWPSFIASTCFRTDEQRAAFGKITQDEQAAAFVRTGEVDKVVQMLRLLWSQAHRNAYGPFGLELVLKENAFNLSIV